MSIRAVTSTVGGRLSISDSSQEIESLNREKERLKQEISEIRSNSFMTGSEKRVRMQTLSTKISTISGKIQSLAKTQKCEKVQKTDEKAEEKEKLMDKKLELQKEISEVRTSNNMDQQEKNTAVMKLMMEINTIENKVRSLISKEVNDMQVSVSTTDTENDSSKDLEEKINLFIGADDDDEEQRRLRFNKINIRV